MQQDERRTAPQPPPPGGWPAGATPPSSPSGPATRSRKRQYTDSASSPSPTHGSTKYLYFLLFSSQKHLVRAQRIGDSQDAAGAHEAGQDADIGSGAGVANAGAEVGGNNPKAMSPKRKKSPQWGGVVFKPDILRTPLSPSSSPRRTLPSMASYVWCHEP